MNFTPSSISDSIQLLLKNNKPFVFYKKNSFDTIKAIVQQDTNLYTTSSFTEEGFVFAPFDKYKQVVLFPLNKSELLSFDLPLANEKWSNSDHKEDEDVRANYLKLVAKTVDFIHSHKAGKVVVSRVIEKKYDKDKVGNLYEHLVLAYPNAFVYVWYHPKVGLWMGATPEKLLSLKEDCFSTMALAGTKLFKKDIIWEDKEKEEQQWVTDFITNQLLPIVEYLEISKPYTSRAGHLAHIRTDITGYLKVGSTLQSLIAKQHPTPAVCGTPRNTTRDFLLKNEGYDRSYYTGYLGEINLDLKTDLYVNLRCMELNATHAKLYVGGGITKDSVPEEEWTETVNKAAVLGRFLG